LLFIYDLFKFILELYYSLELSYIIKSCSRPKEGQTPASYIQFKVAYCFYPNRNLSLLLKENIND